MYNRVQCPTSIWESQSIQLSVPQWGSNRGCSVDDLFFKFHSLVMCSEIRSRRWSWSEVDHIHPAQMRLPACQSVWPIVNVNFFLSFYMEKSTTIRSMSRTGFNWLHAPIGICCYILYLQQAPPLWWWFNCFAQRWVATDKGWSKWKSLNQFQPVTNGRLPACHKARFLSSLFNCTLMKLTTSRPLGKKIIPIRVRQLRILSQTK